MVTVNVSRELTIKNTLPQYKLDQTKVTDVHKSLDTSNQYFGQPDMIRTKSGRLITSFPQGHGKGPLIMKISDDDGATWTRKTDIPASCHTNLLPAAAAHAVARSVTLRRAPTALPDNR